MALVIFAVLWKLRTRPRAQGSLFALWMVLAGVERLIVEVFRAKDDRFFGPFTLAQVISVVLIAGGIYILYRLGKGRPAEAASG
jgi:phosphatidylglycerol:prolipoprotein diacylglycerol transferase